MIETKRLVLRPVKRSDAEDIYEYSSDPDVTRFVTYDTYSSLSDAYTSLDHFFLNRDLKTHFEALAIVDKSTNKMIGTVDASKIFNTDNVEVGYVLNRDYWNQGIMSEALAAYCDYLFNEKSIRRIELSHVKRNLGSKRVAEKVGFVFEGFRREYGIVNGRYEDMPFYSLLKGDLINDIK